MSDITPDLRKLIEQQRFEGHRLGVEPRCVSYPARWSENSYHVWV